MLNFNKSTNVERKQKRPVLLMLALMLMVVIALTGCHKANDIKSFDLPEQFDSTKNYEITFWAKNDTNKTQVNIYNKAVEDFQKIYPNIKVNIKFYTDYAKIYQDVITNIATNTTPNVCISYPDHIATYLTSENLVVPLEDLIMDEKYGLGGSEVEFEGPTQGEIVTKFLDEGSFAGHYYAMPFMRSTEACYINKNLVEKLGYEVPDKLTWDFIWEVSEAAMAQDADGNYKVNGQKVLIPFIYKSTDNMMIQMLKQLEAGYSKSNGEIDIFNDTTKELLYEISKHAETKSFSTFKISSYPGNFLNAGQCIFAIDSTAGATWMGSNAPLSDIDESKKVNFETVVRAIPQFDAENPQMISQGPSLCIFNKEDTSEVLASWLFVQYLLSNDVQIAYSQTEGYVPVTKKAQESTEYQEYLENAGTDNQLHYQVKLDATKLLIDNTENTFVTPVFNGSASLRSAAGQLIEDVVKSKRRKQTVDEAFMTKLYSDTKSLYRLDQISIVDAEDGVKLQNKDLGPLPSTAKALIVTLIVTWILIIAYVVCQFVKSRIKK